MNHYHTDRAEAGGSTATMTYRSGLDEAALERAMIDEETGEHRHAFTVQLVLIGVAAVMFMALVVVGKAM